MAAHEPGEATWVRELAAARVETARFELAHGNAPRAAELAKLASDAAAASLKRAPADRNLLLLAAQTEVLLGRIAAAQKDAARSRKIWIAARDLIAAPSRLGRDPNFLAAYASSLLLLDDNAAGPIVKQLESIGYSTPEFASLTVGKHIAYRPNTAACAAE